MNPDELVSVHCPHCGGSGPGTFTDTRVVIPRAALFDVKRTGLVPLAMRVSRLASLYTLKAPDEELLAEIENVEQALACLRTQLG